jgi:hypothetical protein
MQSYHGGRILWDTIALETMVLEGGPRFSGNGIVNLLTNSRQSSKEVLVHGLLPLFAPQVLQFLESQAMGARLRWGAVWWWGLVRGRLGSIPNAFTTRFGDASRRDGPCCVFVCVCVCVCVCLCVSVCVSVSVSVRVRLQYTIFWKPQKRDFNLGVGVCVRLHTLLLNRNAGAKGGIPTPVPPPPPPTPHPYTHDPTRHHTKDRMEHNMAFDKTAILRGRAILRGSALSVPIVLAI